MQEGITKEGSALPAKVGRGSEWERREGKGGGEVPA
jgi:hypothetical protein